MVDSSRNFARVEWLTLGLILLTTAAWAGCVFGLAALSPTLAVLALAPIIALHSSLQHEAIHGHPTRHAWLNAALVWPAFTLVIPYARFRDSHLAHHHDERLTDPYDDPETNYLDPEVWGRLPRWAQLLLRANATLAGRMVLGPAIGTVLWALGDLRQSERAAVLGWLTHIPPLVAVLVLVQASPLSVWAYALAAYMALSLLKIRTFLEHQAHQRASGRTVIIEDRGPLAFLFLNNNLHVVHHMHPQVPWYALPRVYARKPQHYLRRNGGYLYRSYAEVFRRHLWCAKDPVAHPLWPRR